jgi:cAMP phosphodiesterase
MHTTAFLLDRDILIDAGPGVERLSIDELMAIDHVFLTHSHLDHVAALAFLLDTVGDVREQPITVHATPATIEILRAHVFNWTIWPDFTEIPSANNPFLRFSPIHGGQAVEIAGRKITPLPVNHTVPAVAYRLDSGAGSLVFSGDTGPCPDFWAAVNQIDNLRYVLIECAFPDSEKSLARASLHLCPSLLIEQLALLKREADIYITHLKPGQSETTMREIQVAALGRPLSRLREEHVFEL